MLEAQKKLDIRIFKNKGIKEYPFKNIKLALLVELGELCNEDKCFKYWKKHREIDRNKILDEFADCLHFALSLENYYLDKGEKFKIDNYNFEDAVKYVKTNKQTLNDRVEGFLYVYNSMFDNTRYILVNIVALGLLLGISLQEMEQAYYKKNKVNYKRQEEGY